MSVLSYPTCPTDCLGSLPDPVFSECAPETGYGEVEYLYIAKADSDDLTNVEDLSEWTTKLGLAATDDNAIRKLTVLGDLPEPEVEEIARSGDRIVRGFKNFNFNFEIDEDGDENYEMLLSMECGLKYKMWLETADGMLFGGNEGIEATINVNYLIPRSRTELRKIVGVAKWKAIHSPLRSVSPMA